jgi:glycosyltransferase involved in cell wall biosynthesis
MKTLTVIIPIYNEEAFLKRCLDSIPIRDDVEVICIDDGSTDGSRAILKSYGDRFKVILHKENRGVSAARNEGINYASGKYLTFLDSDDEMNGGQLVKIVSMLNITEIPIIQINHLRCHEDGCKLVAKFSAPRGFYGLKNLPAKWAPVWNKFYLRKFVEDNGIYFNEGQQFDEDRLFNLNCLRKWPEIWVPDCDPLLKKHFDNDQSLCHTVSKIELGCALDELVNFLRFKANSPELQKVVRQSIIMHLKSDKANKVFGGEL